MFMLSCFQALLQNKKEKKIVQSYSEAMAKAMQDDLPKQVSNDSSSITTSSNPLPLEAQVQKQMNINGNHISITDSVENSCKSEDQDHDIIPTDQCKKNRNRNPEFQVSSAFANNDSSFSVGDSTPSDKDALENSDTQLSAEFAGDSAEQTCGPSTLSLMKSHSLPPLISRSSNDLHALSKRLKEVFIEESHMDSYLNDGVDSYPISGSAKDEVMPSTNEMRDIETLRRDSSSDSFGDYPNRDFKSKRIEDWVTGLHNCEPPPEINNDLPEYVDPVIDVNTKNGVIAAKVDLKVTPGMEAAEKYISYLNADATMAILANQGLVVIPPLSAFATLKVLNLSGNAIVRITAGSLPRGLHVLNLSKNNISTIEGLRELTRLRVLDLSYNRIVRIGHGLASCPSLKELYLAGNKISEVEGLHRLLKLSILDLRFNKFSTAKCLGQLAANYNSLQAISLEGNYAQKNVGDDQLKKYLQGLLPHLVYYNRQPIKVSTWKDEAERSTLLRRSSSPFDRSRSLSIKSDRKTATRNGSGPLTSSTSGRLLRVESISGRIQRVESISGRIQRVESIKLSKGKQIQLRPSIGTRGSTQIGNHFDGPSKELNSTPKHRISKSRSEGNLGSL